MPPIRRTYKIVRSEIALNVDLPTLNDGACTIMSLPSHYRSSPPHLSPHRPFILTPDERPCVAWLDWQGHHAKFFCVFNKALRRYSHFVMDRRSVDTRAKRFEVDIRFSRKRETAVYAADSGGWVKRDGGRVRDENRNLYMVIEIRVDDGKRIRSGKAYGKLMTFGMGDETVSMTLEEGLQLGCRMEVESKEEKHLRIRERVQLCQLRRELVEVKKMIDSISSMAD